MEFELMSAKHRIALVTAHFKNGMIPQEIKLMDDVQDRLQQAYLAGAESADNCLAWSNETALGYAIGAAERAGFSENDVQRLVRALHNSFDTVSLEEAAEHYRRSSY